jgi:hypothetical protein
MRSWEGIPVGTAMRVRGIFFFGVLAAAVLSACALVDPLDSRYDTISRSLAKSRNDAIFLNLVRAANDYPLDFVTIANVTPSLTNTTSFALPSFLLGPSIHGVEPASPGRDVIFGNSTAANATAVSTNFNVATQETGAFYDGFLKPIDLQILDYFIRQGYSRELLFWLFTQSIEIHRPAPDKSELFVYDPPGEYGCLGPSESERCISGYILLGLFSGLTVEGRTKQLAPSQQRADTSSAGQNNGNPNKPQTVSFFRFCFDPLLAEQARRAAPRDLVEMVAAKYPRGAPFSPICGDPKWDPFTTDMRKPQLDTLNFYAGKVTFRIRARSAFGIFEFLGKLIKIQTSTQPLNVDANSQDANFQDIVPMLRTIYEDHYLFKVDSGGGTKCFEYTWLNNKDYCVPEDAANAKRIFNLLAQLIAIQTSATDLSITPTVRVVQ